MENYKEKYEKAVKNLKKIKDANKNNKALVDFIEYEYPELKESEDEKVRNDIIELVKQSSCILNPMNQKSMIAWLKKQGAKESEKTSIWNHWNNGIAGNREGKLIYLIKNGNDYMLSSSLGFECDYILLSDLDKLL